MTCNEIEKRLPAYLENLLSPEEKKGVEGHLAACPRCGRAFKDLRKMEGIVQNLTEVEPPPFLEQRIMARVREEAERKQGILRKLFYPLYIKVPLQAFATLLVAVMAFSIYRTVEPELEHLAPPAITLTEPAKDPATTESRKAATAPAAVTQVQRAPAGDLPEKKQQPLAAPAVENGIKADRMAGSPPLKDERALTMKHAAPAVASREKDRLPLHTEALMSRAQDRAGKQEAEPFLEASPPENKRKGKLAPIVTTPDPSQGTAASAIAAKRSVLDLTIQVRDVPAAVREVEERLRHISGRIIEKQRHGGRELLKAELAAQNLAAFLDGIEAIGRVKSEKSQQDVPDGTVTVNIEIAMEP